MFDCCTARNSPQPSTPRPSTPRRESVLTTSSQKMLAAKNRFVKSKRFQKMVRSAFDEVDINKSNSLDGNEVYIAVLLLYLKINGICKGAVPPSQGQIADLVKKIAGSNKPGELDYDQFLEFCQFLCGEIAGRVSIQMFLQMVVAPLLGLLVCEYWEKAMMHYFPELFAFCSSYVPANVIVTLFVGIAVGFFVPPMMHMVDKFVLHEAGSTHKTQPKKKKWF